MSNKFFFAFLFTMIALSGLNQKSASFHYGRIQSPVNDTAKVNSLNYLAKYHINVDQDSARFYLSKALFLSELLNYKKGLGYAKLTQGILASDRGEFPSALTAILEATELGQEIKDYTLLAGCKLNLGNFYIKTNDIPKALKIYKEGIELANQHGLTYTQGSLMTSYGMGLKMQGYNDSAIYYYEKVLELHYNQLHDTTIIAAIYNNMASAYFSKKDYQTAENYLVKSYELNKIKGNQRYQLLNLSNLGELAGVVNNDLKKSLIYFKEAEVLAHKMKSKEALETIHFGRSQVYHHHKKYKEAFDDLVISVAYKDSILLGEGIQNEITTISEKFKTRQIQDSLQIQQQELALAKSNQEAAELKAAKSTLQVTIILIALVLILIVLYFVFRNAKAQKQNNVILQQKNEEINFQKLEIEEQKNELTDSINYAKRIQHALLPHADYLNAVFENNFVIYKPKDIVSGDFYWAKKSNKKRMVAVADCTGHGVPGAMLSMLAIETIEKNHWFEGNNAAEFITKINQEFVNTLAERFTENNDRTKQLKDGMDLALAIVTEDNLLNFCGANNACYVLREKSKIDNLVSDKIKVHEHENYVLLELKATKRPIGFYDGDATFTSVEIQLEKNDVVYLFTDGYADQFGGDGTKSSGKKLKSGNFRNTILNNGSKTLFAQKTNLIQYLNDWQGSFAQVDDITVFAFQV